MELISLSVLFSLVALCISLPLMFLLSRNRTQSCVPCSILPPGTFGWPIIGETLEFLKGTFIEERMEKFSSQIFKTSILGEPVAVFCGPEGTKFLFSNEKQRVTRWYPRQIDTIFPFSTNASDEEGLVKTLKIFRDFLKAESLESYVEMMDSTAKLQLRNSWASKNVVHVSALSQTYTFSLGCKLLVGIDDPTELAELHDQFDILLKGYLSLPINFYGTPFNKAVKASNYIRKDLFRRIKRRKMELADGNTTNDIFSQMFCTSEDGGKETEQEAEANAATRILGLLVAGDAASIIITFILKYLAELPHVYDQVLKEQREILKTKLPGEFLNWEDIQKMKYSWNVAREVMRLHAPTRGTFREALTDFTYAGFSVPKGWKLYWNNATHKDAKYFPDPEKFDPWRFEGAGPPPYTYLPFGGGSYRCPGNGYARLEILIFMHNLVTKFKWEKIFSDEKITYNPFPTLEKGLPIRLQPHVF